MQKVRCILLLFIMGIIVFPWRSICLAHPLGESHHHEGKSVCELRKEYKGTNDVYWPPMECDYFYSSVDKFEQPQNNHIVPTFQMLAVFAAIFDLVPFEDQEQLFLVSPTPNCRSATILSDNILRGLPLV